MNETEWKMSPNAVGGEGNDLVGCLAILHVNRLRQTVVLIEGADRPTRVHTSASTRPNTHQQRFTRVQVKLQVLLLWSKIGKRVMVADFVLA